MTELLSPKNGARVQIMSGAMREFIKKSIRKGDQKKILYLVDHGKIRPSKSLQDCVTSMIQGNR